MTLMKWSAHFLTGIELVDRQHRHLVDLVNTVAPMLACNETTPAECLTLIDQLTDYAATHFRTEEECMRAGGLADSRLMNEHVHIHQGFVAEVARMRQQVDAGVALDGEQTIRFLASWLTFHILVEDQTMVREMRRLAVERGEPSLATVVEPPATGDGDGVVNAVLVDALTDLFSVVSQRNRTLVETNAKLKSAQARLAELNSDLETQVAARTHQLQQMNEDLLREQASLQRAMETIEQTQGQLLQSEKMAAVGQLAAGVAHEINNPTGFVSSNLGSLRRYIEQLLAIIDADQTAIEALAADHPARLIAEARRQEAELDFLREDIPNLLDESAEGLGRVRKIVADLKDFSRMDEAEIQEADLNQGLDSTLNVVANELKYKAKVVRVFGDLPKVRCRPAQINQVFMNLLVNAGQAIDTTGTITLRTGQEGPCVWVEIADTGKGMSPEVRNRLFEPF
ncbi:MAG TPA: bacteriohemerythrin, partial [Accumulibacter sp.]|nr:bacteriohemerythrin [Accumulibacter sp.]